MSIEIPSDRDKVQLTYAVVSRLGRVASLAKRKQHQLDMPPEIHRDMKLFSNMKQRYDLGIYTHTTAESQAEQNICLWLLSEKKRICQVRA